MFKRRKRNIDVYLHASNSFIQGKKVPQDGDGDSEIQKFDGTGYDKDLVEALERDIVSRNLSIHWYSYSFVKWHILIFIVDIYPENVDMWVIIVVIL